MMITLQRGQTTQTADAARVVFSYEAPGSAIRVKQKWHEAVPHPPAESGLLISYQGWDAEQWYDGCLARFEQNTYTDLILPGASCRLHLDTDKKGELQENWQSWAEENLSYARKQSLIQALKIRFIFHKHVELVYDGGHSEAEQILNLLLFRLAFPAVAFSIVAPDAAWRRLAQNLAVNPLRQPARQPQVSLALDWGSDETVRELLHWQKAQSPFVPEKLWDRIR